jgi:hypothetical protein
VSDNGLATVASLFHPFRAGKHTILKSFKNVSNYSRPRKTRTLKKHTSVVVKWIF